jgi:hypothetical protein
MAIELLSTNPQTPGGRLVRRRGSRSHRRLAASPNWRLPTGRPYYDTAVDRADANGYYADVGLDELTELITRPSGAAVVPAGHRVVSVG